VSNPSYETWMEQGQQVVSYSTKSMSKDILCLLFELEHATDFWAVIFESSIFHPQCKPCINMLKLHET
jgi:hypothetical protein